ncbi:MAG: hypothetical protein KME55_30265 [Nostoc indistinguendum CM1-VF10]|jgi:hypothetical protein|nr:hypothetical protein [Nostoc indistinguendum CM1-VF10]
MVYIIGVRARKCNRLHPNAKRVCKLPNLTNFNQPQNQVPPGLAAGSLKLVLLKPPEMIPMTNQV